MFGVIEQLRELVGSYRDAMAELTAKLIAIDTENPLGRGYKKCLDIIGEALEALGFWSQIEPVPGGDVDSSHPRFWLRSGLGEGERAVYFHGHVDVVPADDPSQFEPRVTDDTIFGRGSTDMKGGLVSMIYAMKALSEAGVVLDGKLALRIVPDEETGGTLGSRALAELGQLAGDDAVTMFTAEPTGGTIWHASRGAITCRIKVKGLPSHVGLQYRGVNAFEKMLTVAAALSGLKDEVEQRVTSYPLEPEQARHSILMIGGEASGGRNFNVVPECFTFTVDRRINPEEDFDTERERLLEVVRSAAENVDVEVDVFQEARPAAVSETHPAARVLARAIEDVRGTPARFELCPGILEIRFYAERGVPAFAYGPGLLTVAHGPKEFIKRRDLEDVAVVYALTAARLLSP